MTAIRTSAQDPLVMQLLKVLGAPKHVRMLSLRASVDEAVTVTVEYFPERNGELLPDALIEEYLLVRCGNQPKYEVVADHLAKQAHEEIDRMVAAFKRRWAL